MRPTLTPFILLLVVVLASCSNSKRLPKGEGLFTGAAINLAGFEGKRKEGKLLQGDLKAMVRPRPNTKTAGVRLKLTFYNFAGSPRRKKGLRKWLRDKAGEAPVLASTVRLETNNLLMQNYLQNRGYFHASVSSAMEVDGKKKAVARFTVNAGPKYIVRRVAFSPDSSKIATDIATEFSKTLLVAGAAYNLNLIKAERVRMDRVLKEKGYFYFNANDLVIFADTMVGGHQVDLYVNLKRNEIPPEAFNTYKINNIFIYANYKLRGKSDDTARATMVTINNYNVIDPKGTFKPIVFSRAMIFEKGDLYSLDDQNLSLSRLVNMGTFKFVKNRFDPINDSVMDVYYYLTPYPRKSLRFEIGGLTQNDNRAGTRGSISWRNRNAFKGAEELTFKINGGFEAQYNGVTQRPNIYNFGTELSLAFPRFVVPIFEIGTLSRYMPRTIAALKYRYESQSNLLRINSYTASYGYVWKEGPRKEHQLFPVNLTYVKTDTLGNADQLRLLYSSLIFNGIILGPTYEFSYNSGIGSLKPDNVFFNGLIDLSGNIMGIAEKADFESNPRILFGSRYAQYVKMQGDFRYFHRFSPITNLATRIVAGLGLPYGNSRQLPNIKQFWAGGNSDLRGFPSRLAGPGTFNERYLYNTTNYMEALGDLKLELNAEIRQNIYKWLNGALFADAGNIWLYRDNPAFPGGKFSPDFYKQLAVDVGVGLRFDFKILILRFDLGMPIRKPWLPENNRWVFQKISFADPTWKRDNLLLNIAIGYPF